MGTDKQWWEQTNMLWINNQSGDNEIGWEGKNGELSEAKQTVSEASYPSARVRIGGPLDPEILVLHNPL